MNDEHYDIFLSYRRNGGWETAKHLFDLLTRDGYAVSFDIDTLRSGDFDTQLLHRIDQCTDFILILDKNVFDRSIDPDFDRNKDWLRIELAYALEKDKNIIPVMLNGFDEFPDNLPDDIAVVERKNGPKYDSYYFDAFYKKLIRFLDSKPKQTTTPAYNIAPNSSTLKIKTDVDCKVFVDDEEMITASAGKITRLSIKGGSYTLKFVSTECEADFIEDELFRIQPGTEEIYKVVLIHIQEKRKAKEWKQYCLQLPDDQILAYKQSDGDKYGFKDINTGKIIIPCIYEVAYGFSEGLARVRKNGKWGFIDKVGKVVIPLIYGNANYFSEGWAPIKDHLSNKWGFIDKNCNVVIPFIYEYAYPFNNGIAFVNIKDKGYKNIDKTGKEIK